MTGVERDRHGTVIGITGRARDGETVRVAARIVVVPTASGRRSPRLSTRRTSVSGRSVAAVTYGYWTGLVADGYEWNFRPDAASGVVPTNDGQACVFASASPRRIGRGGWDPSRASCRDASRPRRPARPAAPPAALRTFTGRPGYLRRAWGNGWALVGDAGYFKDPLGAHGLTDALRDAELLARAIVAVIRDGAGNATPWPATRRPVTRCRQPSSTSPM